MIAFTFIRYLCKVVAHLKYCSEIAYQHIEQLNKDNENLRKTPEQKSK